MHGNSEAKKYENMVDLFSLKVLALIVARGSTKEKANLFTDLVIGRESHLQGVHYFFIDDPRLLRALKEIIYFSEIFPK